MTAAYFPSPGTVAYRGLGHLSGLPKGAEIATTVLAVEINSDSPTVIACMEAPLREQLVFRRQKDAHPRSPWFWSLTDHTTAGTKPTVSINKDYPVHASRASHAKAEKAAPSGPGRHIRIGKETPKAPSTVIRARDAVVATEACGGAGAELPPRIGGTREAAGQSAQPAGKDVSGGHAEQRPPADLDPFWNLADCAGLQQAREYIAAIEKTMPPDPAPALADASIPVAVVAKHVEGRNVCMDMHGDIAVEAVDGTVITFRGKDGERVRRLFGATV